MTNSILRRMAAAAFAAASTAGCGAKPEPPKEQAPPAPPAALRTIDIHASDFAFQAPDTIEGGWVTIRVDNTGKELHHAALVRLDQGKTIADLATLKPESAPPAWAVMMGGPNAAAPGGPPVEATVNLPPGTYVLMCVIPSPDHAPHFVKGMVKPLTVVAPAVAASAPSEPDISVTLVDYAFELSKPITAGKHTLRLVSAPGQPHEFIVAKLEAGKTPSDLLKWVDNMTGPPPAMIIGGTTPLNGGEEARVTIDFAPGEYALICFYPDVKDAKYHAFHGMMTQIKVL